LAGVSALAGLAGLLARLSDLVGLTRLAGLSVLVGEAALGEEGAGLQLRLPECLRFFFLGGMGGATGVGSEVLEEAVIPSRVGFFFRADLKSGTVAAAGGTVRVSVATAAREFRGSFEEFVKRGALEEGGRPNPSSVVLV
jgi:hypothetical protein